MKKDEFISLLGSRLSGLNEAEAKERLSFYSEMIDDRTEDGLSEEEAVAAIGDIDGIVAEIAAEVPLGKLVKEKVKSKRAPRAWEIVLLAVGFPLWFPLTVAAFAALLALYISLWAVIISFIAVDVSLAAFSLCALGFAALSAFRGSMPDFAALLGAALISAGVFILFLLLTKAMIKGAARLTKKSVRGLKTSLLGRRNNL